MHTEDKYYEKYAEYEKYIKIVDKYEDSLSNDFDIDFTAAKDNMSEDELKVFIIYSSFKRIMGRGDGAEIIDIAEMTLEELKKCSLDVPLSTEFINSLFSFDTVFKVLYDLLKLAVDGKYRGNKMSNDYINGVIDSIVVLKKFQRTNGFGDFEWTMMRNDSIDNTPKFEE